MNAGPTAERVYHALKRDVLGYLYRPGDHLEPAAIAERLASSVTPVRDALHLLAGEGLVESRYSEGFRLPPIDQPALQDLYDWSGELALIALRNRQAGVPIDLGGEVAGDIAGRTAWLFERMAAASSNVELRRAIAAANDRLHAARLAEPQVLPDCEDELGRIALAAPDGDAPALRRLLRAYVRRRRRAAAAIVRALYRREPAENIRDIFTV